MSNAVFTDDRTEGCDLADGSQPFQCDVSLAERQESGYAISTAAVIYVPTGGKKLAAAVGPVILVHISGKGRR